MGDMAAPVNEIRTGRLPPWLKRPRPDAAMLATRAVVEAGGVATVCREARCPNVTECWSRRTATFMILGSTCTRSCRFCAVSRGRPLPPAGDEPQRLAEAVAGLGLRHVVITSVSRDDLEDEGASHFAACVREVRARLPESTIEVLPPDFHAREECILALCQARPDVYNHNIETVERLTPQVRPQADYRRSLRVLRLVGQIDASITTKSGLMIGMGETGDEIGQTLSHLREVGCGIVTIGQYLQPSKEHWPVVRYYTPEEFEELAVKARAMGFAAVAAGPFVRSSYNAGKVFSGTAIGSSGGTAGQLPGD
ncbi:MAG TPA: lipoyl synthase [Phycisphaerae bacterium]|nr:lipoyl synthase [Phycisphaerae bacterium]